MSRKPTTEEYRIARENGINSALMYSRMIRSWDAERAMYEPVNRSAHPVKDRVMAVYKGEKELGIGTVDELAEKLNVKKDTLLFYTKPTYQRRIEKRNSDNSRVAFWLDDDDED